MPPEGYIINGNRVQVRIPIREGLSIMAKFIKQLPDGCVACLMDREGFKDMPYIVKLYTPRQPSTGAIFPMPAWLD